MSEAQALIEEVAIERSPFAEDIMTLTEMWLERGKKIGLAEGEAKGEARGEVNSIVKLYRDGTFSADQARSRLKLIAQQQGASAEMIDEALRSIAD
jgi:hypothetical protein